MEIPIKWSKSTVQNTVSHSYATNVSLYHMTKYVFHILISNNIVSIHTCLEGPQQVDRAQGLSVLGQSNTQSSVGAGWIVSSGNWKQCIILSIYFSSRYFVKTNQNEGWFLTMKSVNMKWTLKKVLSPSSRTAVTTQTDQYVMKPVYVGHLWFHPNLSIYRKCSQIITLLVTVTTYWTTVLFVTFNVKPFRAFYFVSHPVITEHLIHILSVSWSDMNVKDIFLLYVWSKVKNMASLWSNWRTRERII